MSEFRTEPATDRGIAIRVGVSGDDGSMIELTSIIPEDCAQDGLQARIEKLNGAARAVRAKTQLPALRAEAAETEKILNQNKQRRAEMVAGYEERQRQHDEQILRGRELIADLTAAGEAAWRESGRQGSYDPRGHDKRRINDMSNAIAGHEAAKSKADGDHLVGLSGIENEIARKTTALEILDRRIKECEALGRGEDISGV